MSTPVHGTESDDKFLQYAPRRIREGVASGPPTAPPRDVDDAPMVVPRSGGARIGGSNISGHESEAPPLPPRFEGDIAIEALRRRMALEPQRMPEPPIRLRRASRMAWIVRLSTMCAVAGVGAFGLTWMTAKPADQVQGNDREIVAPAIPVGTKSARAAPARLVIESQRGDVNEPLPLGIALDGKAGGEKLQVAGFAEGTRLSAGVSLGRAGWLLSASDVGKAMAYAPQDFVGAMDARVDLRAADDQMLDSQFVRLEWVAKQGGPRLAALPSAAATEMVAPRLRGRRDRRAAQARPGVPAHWRYRLGAAAVAAGCQWRQRRGGAGAGRNLRRRSAGATRRRRISPRRRSGTHLVREGRRTGLCGGREAPA